VILVEIGAVKVDDAGMGVCCEYCVLLGRVLCEELITPAE
jgi:hypothetical protein